MLLAQTLDVDVLLLQKLFDKNIKMFQNWDIVKLSSEMIETHKYEDEEYIILGEQIEIIPEENRKYYNYKKLNRTEHFYIMNWDWSILPYTFHTSDLIKI